MSTVNFGGSWLSNIEDIFPWAGQGRKIPPALGKSRCQMGAEVSPPLSQNRKTVFIIYFDLWGLHMPPILCLDQ